MDVLQVHSMSNDKSLKREITLDSQVWDQCEDFQNC